MPALEAAAKKQAMIGQIQTRDMRLRPSGNRPLRDNLAFFSVNYFANALAVHNISHAYVQPVVGRVEYYARRFGSMHRDATHKFSGLGVHDLDGAIHCSGCADAGII